MYGLNQFENESEHYTKEVYRTKTMFSNGQV
jgi:hypothetical protein